ncbi:MAG: DEAD/DEAH box helicase [Clostridia bacterium]|nr:DEAD/DEAH box helicase [Clostridia bacterium]
MFKITDFAIRSEASDSRTFARGLEYYHAGRVKEFEFDPENAIATAIVKGGENYEVELTFHTDGSIHDMSCECPAYYEYEGACKHIVSVLLRLQKELERKELVYRKNVQSVNLLFSHFVSSYNESPLIKTEIKLVPLLKIEEIHDKCYVSLELFIGKEKLYVVRDIKALLNSIRSKQQMAFGKMFVFNPVTDHFTKDIKPLIDLLMSILSEEETNIRPYGFNYSRDSQFEGKKFYFKLLSFDRFVEIMKDKTFNMELNGTPVEDVSVLEDKVPLTYMVSKDLKGLILSDTKNDTVRLFEQGSYFFQGRNIYKVPQSQSDKLAPLYSALKTAQGKIVIPNEGYMTFVSLILPQIKKAADLKIDKSLDENFIREELAAKIYFDKYGEGISARIEFNYGEIGINPLSKDSDKDLELNNKLLVRDLEKEKEILAFIVNAGFKSKGTLLVLQEEAAIYDFVTSVLPNLKEKCEVFYSDDFKNLKINYPKVSSSVRISDSSNMLEVSFDWEGIDPAELSSVFQSLRLKKKYHRLKNGSFISMDNGDLASVSKLLEQLDISDKELSKKLISLPKYRALYLDNYLRESDSHYMERSAAFKQMVQNIKEPEDMDYEVPHELENILRDYQKVGFKWLKTLSAYNMGGILADDMGLGKTLQVLAFVLSEKPVTKHPALVIAPKSLLYNWQDEVKKFVPQMNSLVISGVPSERRELAKQMAEADIVITSYSLIRSDIDLYEKQKFSYCFLDEAQHIKNPNTLNAKSVKMIKAKGYFALTGTPIENSLTELWSIFDFVMPGYLLSHNKFAKKFEIPIVRNTNQDALKELSRHTKPFILRRLKRDVLKELPEKIESKIVADMTDEQKKIYLAYLHEAKREMATEINQKGFEKSQIKILSLLTRLRQICCHPALFIDSFKGESGKIQLLSEILEDAFDSGHRVLLFSQFTGALSLIRRKLDSDGIKYFYLDGSTSAEERIRLVKDFNAGTTPLFLISLKAGGTGLNLTGADTVIHFDPWWNPAVEEQAADRAYRIGQQNVVQVIKLITQGTIEERIFELQQKKRALIDSVVTPGETFLSKMSEQEIKSLFEG